MKTVLIHSGGLDSTVLLAHLLNKGDEVTCLNFNYGSKHAAKEMESAKVICEYYDVEQKVIELKLDGLFVSSLLQSGNDIPDGHYAAENMKQTVVPFRNGIMLSMAIGFAESIEAPYVAIGAHSGDHYIYPDCRPAFLAAMSHAAWNGTEKHIQLVSPFRDMTKGDVVKKGGDLGVPFDLTWTCYKGGARHCGTCGSCSERKEAFLVAGLDDPTEYVVQGMDHMRQEEK